MIESLFFRKESPFFCSHSCSPWLYCDWSDDWEVNKCRLIHFKMLTNLETSGNFSWNKERSSTVTNKVPHLRRHGLDSWQWLTKIFQITYKHTSSTTYIVWPSNMSLVLRLTIFSFKMKDWNTINLIKIFINFSFQIHGNSYF